MISCTDRVLSVSQSNICAIIPSGRPTEVVCLDLIKWKQILEKGSRLMGPACDKQQPTAVWGSYHSHSYSGSGCMLTLTPTPEHYFLMSNHHLTGAQKRQLITNGKWAGHSNMIRPKKYLGDKRLPKTKLYHADNVHTLCLATKLICFLDTFWKRKCSLIFPIIVL